MGQDSSLNILGVIPARGGSVRMPLKNIRNLAGKPLIAYTIEAAQNSRYLRRVIISTDHPRIKRVSLKYGSEVPFRRPSAISGNCSCVKVVQHAVQFVEREEKRRVDIVVTLQPTSPFCRTEDINSCIKTLIENRDIESVFTASEVFERPEWMFRLKKGGRARLYLPGSMKGKRIVRHLLNKVIIPNGAVYATRRRALFEEGVLISKHTAVWMMPRERSIDIDDEIDFRFAEFLIKTKSYREGRRWPR